MVIILKYASLIFSVFTYDGQGRIPEVTFECMLHLRQTYPTVKISVEVEKPGRNGLQELAAVADVVFYSKSWAQVGCKPLMFVYLYQFLDQGQGYLTPEECLVAQARITPKAYVLSWTCFQIVLTKIAHCYAALGVTKGPQLWKCPA